jgi:PAS domain S-box-containing protein
MCPIPLFERAMSTPTQTPGAAPAHALRIAVTYVCVSLLWVLFSDRAVELLSSDVKTFTFLHSAKEWLFVAATGVLVFLLVRRQFEKVLVFANRHVESEVRYRKLVENAPDAIYVYREGRVVLANRACQRLFGASAPEQLLGKTPFDLFHPDFHEVIRQRLNRMHDTGEAVPLIEEKIIRLDGQTVDVEVAAVPYPDQGKTGIHVVLRDISARKDAEQALRESEARLRQEVEAQKVAEQHILHLSALYTVLYHTNEAIVRTDDPDTLFKQTCRIAVEHGGLRMAWIGMLHADGVSVSPRASFGEHQDYLKRIRVSADPDQLEGRGPAGTALRTGIHQVFNDFLGDPETLPWHEAACEAGFHAAAAFPLYHNGRVSGALILYAGESGFFNEEIVTVLDEMALDIGYALGRFELEAERNRVEAALRRSEKHFRALASVSPAGIFRTSAKGELLYVNQRWCEITGLRESDVLGTAWTSSLFAQDRKRVAENWRRSARRQGVHEETCRIKKPDGTLTWVVAQATVERDTYGRTTGYIGCITDITELKRSEQAYRESEQRLISLSHQMLHVQEEERRALARELHDEVGQQLAALKLNLQTLNRDPQWEGAQARFADCLEIVETTLGQIRFRALDLRPSVLDDLGLVPALRWYASRQSERAECVVSVEAALITARPPAEVETVAFRIVQEAVNNALRHGHAKHVAISARMNGKSMVIRVRDDGCGFDVGRALERGHSGKAMGLLGMQERAWLVGGSLELHSTPGAGAEVVATLPQEVAVA